MNKFISFFKHLLKKNKRVSRDVYAVYLEGVFVYESLVSHVTNRLITLLGHIVVKENITSVTVKKHGVELSYLGKPFHWDPLDRTSMLGLAFSGVYEKQELTTMLKFMRPGMTVFDIGANFGLHSVFFADRVGQSGRVYSFEPLRQTYKELVRNARLNNVTSRITAENLGLSNKSGTATMYIAKALGSGATSLRKRWYGKNSKNTCRLVTMDNYVKSHKIRAVNFIKCDVEGAELMVFMGARETLRQYHPILFFESIDNHTELFGYTTQALISFLKKFSYDIYFLQDGKLLKTSEAGNGNYLALPKTEHT